ncbi:MAG TPA: hypothetical protein VNZ26_36250 [Vicinamibacterales bacterium]|nr:hypothetical protein [Vicinamibacterales bacterium]
MKPRIGPPPHDLSGGSGQPVIRASEARNAPHRGNVGLGLRLGSRVFEWRNRDGRLMVCRVWRVTRRDDGRTSTTLRGLTTLNAAVAERLGRYRHDQLIG